MIQKETTGMILRRPRGDRAQGEITATLGITESSWAMHERGERAPRDEAKTRIANFFNRTVQELLCIPIEYHKRSQERKNTNG